MEPNSRGAALVTGASKGIGLELAKLLAKDGYPLVLVARSKHLLERHTEELKQLGGPQVTVIAKDLALPGAAKEIFEETEKQGIKIEVLINNAGYGALGHFAKSDLQTQSGMLQVNVLALTELTNLYLPQLLVNGNIDRPARIMFLSSTAGFSPGPLMAVYFATKAYVTSFSDALHEELKETGVTVTCVAPGATHTNFAERAHSSNVAYFKKGVMDAPTVAKLAYDGMVQGRRMVITGAKNRLQSFLIRHLPRAFVARLVHQMHDVESK